MLSLFKDDLSKSPGTHCNYCNKHFHIRCGAASPKQFKSIQSQNWICNVCLLFNLPFFGPVTLDTLPDCRSQLNTVEADNGPVQENIFKSRSSRQCVTGNLKINSLPSKWLEVQEWIRSFGILSIQETKINNTFPKSHYRRDCKKGGKGILVYVRNSITSYQLKTNVEKVKQS